MVEVSCGFNFTQSWPSQGRGVIVIMSTYKEVKGAISSRFKLERYSQTGDVRADKLNSIFAAATIHIQYPILDFWVNGPGDYCSSGFRFLRLHPSCVCPLPTLNDCRASP